MTTTIAQRPQPAGGLTTWLERPEVHQRIDDALAGIMPAGTFVSHMLTAFQDEKVRRCTDQSKYTALHECAALGLLPTLGQVVLIPYKDELQVMPQWQGYKALMERHPAILEVQAYLVHKRDQCEIVNGDPQHTFDPFDGERQFKSVADIRGGYCKITYRDGRPPKFHFVSAAHIAKAQACAQTQNVWQHWYEQMALKTLYRDCFARRAVPMDPIVQARLQRALDIDDLQLGNSPQGSAPAAHIAPPTTLNALADRLTQPAAEAVQQPPEPEKPASIEASQPEGLADELSEWRDAFEAATTIHQADEFYAKAEARPEFANHLPQLRQWAAEARERIRGGRGERSNKSRELLP